MPIPSKVVKSPRWLPAGERAFREQFQFAGSPRRIARTCCEVSAWHNDRKLKGETVVDTRAVLDGLDAYAVLREGEQPYSALGVSIDTDYPHRAYICDTDSGVEKGKPIA